MTQTLPHSGQGYEWGEKLADSVLELGHNFWLYVRNLGQDFRAMLPGYPGA